MLEVTHGTDKLEIQGGEVGLEKHTTPLPPKNNRFKLNCLGDAKSTPSYSSGIGILGIKM